MRQRGLNDTDENRRQIINIHTPGNISAIGPLHMTSQQISRPSISHPKAKQIKRTLSKRVVTLMLCHDVAAANTDYDTTQGSDVRYAV